MTDTLSVWRASQLTNDDDDYAQSEKDAERKADARAGFDD